MMDSTPLLPGEEDASPLSTKQMQTMHQQMREWLTLLSHEVRTPLTVITTAISLLLRYPLPSKERSEILQIIQQASKRLSTLTDRSLELAQLEVGLVEITYGTVDILSVLREVMVQVQQDIPSSLRDHFTFQLQCQDEAGNPTQAAPLIIGDVRSLHQVFALLLENAVHCSPQGGTLLVMVRPAEQAESHEQGLPAAAFLEIGVCDTGSGIAHRQLERIVAPFYQGESGLTHEVSGLGIGLAICAHLITLHRGRLWATSQEGEGSLFRVWLPRAVVWL